MMYIKGEEKHMIPPKKNLLTKELTQEDSFPSYKTTQNFGRDQVFSQPFTLDMVDCYRTFNKVSITVECQSFWTLGIFHKDLTIRESFWSNKFTVEYFTKLVFLGTGDIP